MERQGGGHTHSQLGMLTDAMASSERDEGLCVVRGVLDFGSATGGVVGVCPRLVLSPQYPQSE